MILNKKNVIPKIVGSARLPEAAHIAFVSEKINGPAFSLRFVPFQLLPCSCPSVGGNRGEDCLDSM